VNNKTTVAATTLLAAIPAGVLGALLVITLMTRLGSMPTMFTVLACVTLLACAGVVFLPAAVMIFGPKEEAAPAAALRQAAPAAPAKKGKRSGGEEAEAADEELGFGDEDALVEAASTGDLPVVEGGMTRDDIGAVDVHLSEADIDAFVEEEFAPAKETDDTSFEEDVVVADDEEQELLVDDEEKPIDEDIFALDDEEDEPPKKKKKR
jgi:hypothetical protein